MMNSIFNKVKPKNILTTLLNNKKFRKKLCVLKKKDRVFFLDMRMSEFNNVNMTFFAF